MTGSVYQQHMEYFEDKSMATAEPRKTIMDDLKTDLLSSMEDGDQLVVMGDFNEDVRRGYVRQTLTAYNLDLVEINQYSRPHDRMPPTSTTGSDPIDGIFVSRCLSGSRCGYLAFGEGVIHPTHRVLWIDLIKSIAFGNSFTPKRPPPRKLHNRDPRVVERYRNELHDHLVANNAFEKLEELQTMTVSHGRLYPIIRKFEKLDKIWIQGVKLAEKRCRRIKPGQVPWTPFSSRLLSKATVWNLIYKKRKGHHVHRRLITRMLRQAGLPGESATATAEEALARYRQALRRFRAYKGQAKQMRKDFTEELAARVAAEKNMDKAKVLKQMYRIEQERIDNQIVSAVNHRSKYANSITSVNAPHPNGNPGERIECHTKEEIENACSAEAIRRFWQASHTPFLQPPIFEKVGNLGTGPGAEEILATGTLTLQPGDPPMDEYTIKMLAEMKRPDDLQELNLEDVRITPEKHAKRWKRAKEATSSGDKILHFGHCKASAGDPDLLHFESSMRNFPYLLGFSPKRWRRGLNCQIVKKKNEFRVEKLRTILLYCADFNDNNKWIGSDSMWHAEYQNLLAPEQYGSRKNKSSDTQGLNQKLVNDIHRQKRLPGARVSNDAKSCYDRIVHSVAMICMRRLGFPKEPLQSMFETIQELDHFIRTSFGDSDSSYSGRDKSVPIQTIGQGNGCGPQLWAAVSTALLNLMRHEGHGSRFIAALTREIARIVGFAFVDDADLMESARGDTDETPEEEVLRRMQAALDTWVGGLNTTGGAVSWEKSHWTMIAFNEKEDGEVSYKSVAETPGSLMITDYDGIRKELRRIEPTVGDRMLGVRLSVDGQDKEEFDYRMDEAKTWRDYVRSGHLNPNLSWKNLTGRIMLQLEYPLAVTTFTKYQCRAIMWPVLDAGLSNSGICRKIARSLAYGPEQFYGFGLDDLYVTQGLKHLAKMVNYGHDALDQTGRLLRISAQDLLLELGTSDPLFTHHRKYLPTATHSWMKTTWLFAKEHDLHLQTDLPTLQKKGQGDHFLMEQFSTVYQGSDLAKLNRCRIYLRVLTLADITTADGKSITISSWNGARDRSRLSPYDWPLQHRPGEACWTLFRHAVSRCFHVNMHSRRLTYPIQRWESSHQQLLYLYSAGDNRIFRRHEDGWNVHSHAQGRRRALYHAQATTHVQELPADATPASVDRNGDRLFLTGVAPPSTPPEQLQVDPHLTFEAFLHLQDDDVSWAWSQLSIVGDPLDLLQSLLNGTLCGVSDGSFVEALQFGTSSWTLFDPSTGTSITGANVIPGPPESQNSYRSEGGGLYGMVYAICALLEFAQQPQDVRGQVELACDNDSCLLTCFDATLVTKASAPSYDITSAVRRAISKYKGIVWLPREIEGHQDEDVSYEDLDVWAQKNVDMDTNAKAYLTDQYEALQYPPQHPIRGQPWTVLIDNEPVVHDFMSTLRLHCSGPPLLEYWRKKGTFGELTAEAIDWIAAKKAMKQLERPQRRHKAKFSSGFFGHNRNMFRWGKRNTDRCPFCEEEETALHVFTCPSDEATEVWQQGHDTLKQHLRQTNTMPSITKLILSRLQAWRADEEDPTFVPASIRQAVEAQDDIGWKSAFHGFWSDHWSTLQDEYFRLNNIRQTGARWLSALIRKLFDVAWDQWQYRNGIVHAAVEGQDEHQLNLDILDEYNQGFQGFALSIRPLTSLSSFEVLSWSKPTKQSWLRRVRRQRELIPDANLLQLQLQNQLMHQVFQPIQPAQA